MSRLIVAALAVLYFYKANCQQVVVEPVNITAAINQAVELRCVFDEPVFCAWQRNGEEFYIFVSVEKGYTYSNGRYLIEKDADCSIKIDAISEWDFGKWRCGAYESSTKPAVDGPEVWISIEDRNLDDYGYDFKMHIAIALGVSASCIAILVGLYYYKLNSAKKRFFRNLIPKSFSNEEVTDNTDSGYSVSPRESTNEPVYLIPIPKKKELDALNLNEALYENTMAQHNHILQKEHVYLKLI